MFGVPLPAPNGRNEVHICLAPNGHKSSTDCWCEPVSIYWYKNPNGLNVLIVEHDDMEPINMHRLGIVYARNQAQDWITRYLDAVPENPRST